MEHIAKAIVGLEPELTERKCGGWLATAPEWAPIRIGVTAPTQAGAVDQFHRAAQTWAANLTTIQRPRKQKSKVS